jgi:hypothetical protein
MKKEFTKLENFVNFLKNEDNELKNPNNNLLTKSISKIKNHFKYLQYFDFINKDNTKISNANLNLMIELKSIMKSNNIKSYISSFTFLYFLTLFTKRRSPIKLVFYIFLTSGVLFYQQFSYSNKIITVVNTLMKKEVYDLYNKLKYEDLGISEENAKNLKIIESKINDSINKQSKPDYDKQTYTKEEKYSLLNLIEFYADWLYSPVNEELENKLYFVNSNQTADDYMRDKIIDYYNNLEDKNNKKFGIRPKTKI